MAQRGAYAPGRLRREEILHAASDLFAEHGYRGASLALIAERVGMSTPGLLHHFPTKEHLLIDLLALRHEQDSERVRKLSTAHGGRLLDALLELAAKNAATPGLVRLFTVLAAESVDDGHPGHEWFVGRYRETRRSVCEMLVDEQRRGLIRDDADIELTAAQILAMFDGVQLQWLLDPEAVDLVGTLGDYLRDLQARLARAELTQPFSAYPTPRSVSSRTGRDGSRSSLRRRLAMCTSHARSWPAGSAPDRWRRISRRLRGRPGCSASRSSSRSSDGVSLTARPSIETSWRWRSMARSPSRNGRLGARGRSRASANSPASTWTKPRSASENGRPGLLPRTILPSGRAPTAIGCATISCLSMGPMST